MIIFKINFIHFILLTLDIKFKLLLDLDVISHFGFVFAKYFFIFRVRRGDGGRSWYRRHVHQISTLDKFLVNLVRYYAFWRINLLNRFIEYLNRVLIDNLLTFWALYLLLWHNIFSQIYSFIFKILLFHVHQYLYG